MGLSDLPPLKFDFSRVLEAPGGIEREHLIRLAPALERNRDEIFYEDLPALANGKSLVGKDPLDTAFVDLPQRLLTDYEMHRGESELGRILATAARLRQLVDRVVVLGIGGSYIGARTR